MNPNTIQVVASALTFIFVVIAINVLGNPKLGSS
jgi:hypothetical protein